MPLYFLDTSALKHRYLKSNLARRIKRLVSDGRNACYIADHTIIEVASALGAICRERNWSVKKFDEMDKRFLEDVASGRIKVRVTTQRDVERARHLVRYAGVVKQRALKSGDSLISVCSLEFALERKQRVIFYTADQKLHSILLSLSAFRSALKLKCLEVP